MLQERFLVLPLALALRLPSNKHVNNDVICSFVLELRNASQLGLIISYTLVSGRRLCTVCAWLFVFLVIHICVHIALILGRWMNLGFRKRFYSLTCCRWFPRTASTAFTLHYNNKNHENLKRSRWRHRSNQLTRRHLACSTDTSSLVCLFQICSIIFYGYSIYSFLTLDGITTFCDEVRFVLSALGLSCSCYTGNLSFIQQTKLWANQTNDFSRFTICREDAFFSLRTLSARSCNLLTFDRTLT